jgi:hypothetical protein
MRFVLNVTCTDFVWFILILPAILGEIIRDFPQFLRENSGIVPRLGHNRSLPNIFQLIFNQFSYYSLETKSAVK